MSVYLSVCLCICSCCADSGGHSLVGGTSEGLDDVCSRLCDLYDDDDADLLPLADKEPEAWSVTVDMKTLRRMNSKDIKRQDHIWGRSDRYSPPLL